MGVVPPDPVDLSREARQISRDFEASACGAAVASAVTQTGPGCRSRVRWYWQIQGRVGPADPGWGGSSRSSVQIQGEVDPAEVGELGPANPGCDCVTDPPDPE